MRGAARPHAVMKNTSSGSQLRAALALITLSVVWGYNWVVSKAALAYASAADFAALRTLLAAVSLFVVLALLRRPIGVA
jgi:drug/metabolite transporter (DMT)-like permease